MNSLRSGIDGKATEMVVDVSKFCAGPVTSEAPNWNNLLNRNLLLAYVTKLKDEAAGSQSWTLSSLLSST